MTVTVRLFSVLRDAVGAGRVDLDDPTMGTVRDVLDALSSQYPVVDRYRGVIRAAVNETYASESDPVHDGDEVALITPVSGG